MKLINNQILKLSYLLIILGAIQTSNAQRSIKINPITSTIKIDGKVDEAIWKQHLQEGNFTQLQPNNGQKSTRKTQIAILNDESYLYVLAVMHVNSKKEINSQLTERDGLGATDFFGFQMDPFGKTREGYDFSVTAANVQYDGKLSALGEDSNFNVVWESAVEIYDDKWIVELKIPFNSIRFPKEDLSNFKVNFQRFSSKLNETSFWNPIKPEIDGFLNQFGELKGLQKVNPPLNLSFNPFIAVINERNVFGDSKTSFSGGLDLKYVYNNAFTLDASLIPDFSNTPSDNAVFNLTPFEVQYNENRQFFVEGTELFDKGGYLYTRRIGGEPINKNNISLSNNEVISDNPIASNILNLIKFTGKTDSGLSIGILNGITDKSYATVLNTNNNETRSVETNPLANYNALVLDQRLKNNSSITFINNSVLRNGSAYDSNLSALLYRWYNKKRTYSMYFKKAISQKYFSNTDNQFGHEYYAYAAKVSGKWTGAVSLKLVDDKFDNNDFGFTPRNNEFRFIADIKYTENKPKNIFSNYQFFMLHQQKYYYSLMKHEQTFYKIGTNGTFKKNNHTFFADYTYIPKSRNFYEARTKDRHFNLPSQSQTFLEYQTNRNKDFSFAGYMVLVKYHNSDIYTNEFISGYGLRARIGQHLFMNFNQSFENIPNSAAFLTRENNDIIFGKRSINQIVNSLNINYSVNSKLNISARLRHFWVQVDYDKQFSLTNNGDFAQNNHTINVDNFDNNFNSFTLDFFTKWQFAPASELSLGYKLGTNFINNDVKSSYLSNLKSTVKEDSNNTISLKMTYFLDFNKIKKVMF